MNDAWSVVRKCGSGETFWSLTNGGGDNVQDTTMEAGD